MWAANWVGAPRPAVLPSPRLEVNGDVERELKWFHAQHRTFLPLSLERREPYYETVAQIFRDEGVPLELMHIALIESGFRTKVKSNAGARGIWQFTKGTARAYGLNVGLWSDERTDPILSSIAAARHLRDLYGQYQDWYLALAAYNAGSGAVNRAIKRSGSQDFWEIAKEKKLPYQTRRYIPRFIAATLILQDPKKYGFDERTVHLARASRPVSLETLG
ncbi:MAG: lytic transglycosylase domain-containing protein [Bdellovibrionales bacterium]|nr:lytic transglycosylase domain-containing protein [Bdellovibrionales bacterium]